MHAKLDAEIWEHGSATKKKKSDGARNMSGQTIGPAVNMLTVEPGCLKRCI